MDLKSGYPWWAVRNGLMRTFPPLERDLRCDVLVVGGGISGALIADGFARHGHEVVVLEQRDIGWGSSAVSTGLLQYEIDTHMVDLARRYGEADAVLAYRACAEAIPALGELASALRDTGFVTARSLYFASTRRHARSLEDEHALRARHGFDVEWLPHEALKARYGIEAPCAILSALGAQIDPYRMTHRLLARLQRDGGGVYDRSAVAHLRTTARGVIATTRQGVTVRARHAVLAAGYASQGWLKARVARNRSSYAFVTDPLDPSLPGMLRRTMVWESARPYLYLSPTSDHRLLVGGEDDAVDIPARRDARVDRKAAALLKRVRKLFPQLPLQPAYSWVGTFAETKDGLPFFGAHPRHGLRVLFAMAYGGNGITYSQIGVELLRATVERRRHPLATLFSFARLER